MIEGAAGYIVNDYEWSLTLERTGTQRERRSPRACAAVIITQGRAGLDDPRGRAARSRSRRCARAKVVDPTGCGDAYRAGLLHARARGRPSRSPGGSGACSARCQVEVEGTQNTPLRAAGAARALRARVRHAPLMEPTSIRALAQARSGRGRGRGRVHGAVDRAPPPAGPRPARPRWWRRPRASRSSAAPSCSRGRPSSPSATSRRRSRSWSSRCSSVLPEYAVDLHFAWKARQGPQLRPLRGRQHDGREPAADRPRLGHGGADRLLPRAHRRARDRHPPAARDALPACWATLYSFVIPLKGTINLFDAVVLLGALPALRAPRPCAASRTRSSWSGPPR